MLFSRPLLYSKWNVGDLNIPEKSEFGHILIRDYFIYVSCIILKNNLIYLYSSQYWGSGGWLICPKPQSWDKAELNETTTSGSTQVPSHKTSMPFFSRLARWLSGGILNAARAPGWDDHEATKRFLIQPRHLPTGNEPSGFWKPFLNILCYYDSCLPQGKCLRRSEDQGERQEMSQSWGLLLPTVGWEAWWNEDGNRTPYPCASASLEEDLMGDCAMWVSWAITWSLNSATGGGHSTGAQWLSWSHPVTVWAQWGCRTHIVH